MSTNIEIKDYKFYKIICNDESITSFYIGSTTDFVDRKQKHKITCYCEKGIGYNLKLYKFIRENCGWDNFDMIELSNIHNINKWEARMIEQAYIDDLHPDLNDKNAFLGKDIRKEQKRISDKTYREGEHRQKNLARKIQYYNDNKEKIKAYRSTQEFKDNKNAKRRENYAKEKEAKLSQ